MKMGLMENWNCMEGIDREGLNVPDPVPNLYCS